jgi:hypothetical protein
MERFWTKANTKGECWHWTGARNEKGYGRFRLNSRNRFAHQVAYELTCGPIPAGCIVMHTCDTPGCVNPAHLRLGTVAENNADKMAKGRHRVVPLKGERNGAAKLTAEAVRAIRASRLSSRREAALYGVSPEAIQQVRRGLTWR